MYSDTVLGFQCTRLLAFYSLVNGGTCHKAGFRFSPPTRAAQV